MRCSLTRRRTTMPDPIPHALDADDTANFDTLVRATEADRICLIAAIRKADGQQVSLVCAINEDEDTGARALVPLAVMLDGNPDELFYDPTQIPPDDCPPAPGEAERD